MAFETLTSSISTLEDGKVLAIYGGKQIYIQPLIVVDTLDNNSRLLVKGVYENEVRIDVTIDTINGVPFAGNFEALETAIRSLALKSNTLISGDIASESTQLEIKDELQDILKTAYGEILVGQLSPIFQIPFDYTVTNTEIGTITKTNSGTVTQADAMAVISTGVATGSEAEWETRRNARYRPGLGGVHRFSALFTTGVEGTEQIVGLTDVPGTTASHKNGYAVGFNGATFSLFRFQNDVLITIPQSSWDDPMNGLGASGMILDPTKLNVYFIQFQYLGAGPIKLWMEDDSTGKMVLAHTVLYTNLNLVPSVYITNFHLSIYTSNGATTANLITKVASMGYFIEGLTKHTDLQQVQQTSENIKKAGVTTEIAIFTIRNKTIYAGKANFMDLLLESLTESIEASAANNLGDLRLIRNAALGGVPVWNDINTTNSIAEIDIAGTTVTGGKTLINIALAGKNDAQPLNLVDFEIFISPGETVTLAAKSANSATINGALLWKELF